MGCSGCIGLLRFDGSLVRIGRIGCPREVRFGARGSGSPTDLDVGAEGVEPGDLSTVTAALLGAFGGIAGFSPQDRDRGSNSSGYNVLAPSGRRAPNMPTARS